MRGIAPETLISQVRNTAPFIFEEPDAWLARAPHLGPVLSFAPARELNDAEYFGLCLAAHHATVATFVPTDVDNQIRHRLWGGGLPVATIEEMARLALASRRWDCRPLTVRFVVSPETGDVVSGHNGEWFSVAVGAYGATRSRLPALAQEVADAVRNELALEARVFAELVARRDGLNVLRCAAMIAHNLGDLARVVEMWGLERDPTIDHGQFGRSSLPALDVACELYKARMAPENHRHFALRRPRALRKSDELLLPIGPFLDDWGARVARHPLVAPEDLGEIACALLEGLERTPGSIGYTRALAGIERDARGGAQGLQSLVPAKTARVLKAGAIRQLIAVPQERFDQQWAAFANQFCKGRLSARPVNRISGLSRAEARSDTPASSAPDAPPRAGRLP